MIEFAVRRPVSVIMMCISVVVLGVIAIQRIPMQLMPNIVSPEFTIITYFKGSTPEEVETLVTSPIERAISTVSGLNRSTSKSERERSEIRLSFNSSINFLETISVIRERLDSAGLPEGSTRPKLVRFQANAEPVIRLALKKNNESLHQIELARMLKDILIRRIESIDGVALATLLGAPVKSVRVEVNPIAVASYGIPITGIPDSIQQKNKSYPAGDVVFEGKRTSVKLGQNLSSMDELKNLIVKKDNQKVVRLQDIANIGEVIEKPLVRTHLQGEDSLIVEVRKEAEANTVHVATAVKEVIQTFLDEYKTDMLGTLLLDQGRDIQAAVDNVTHSVIHGGLLAALVIFLLLQEIWPTFVISLSMPLSLLLTLILMFFSGITFNLMSLAGLALGVGMLVDNSTVVLQSINLMQLTTNDKREAALWGTRKVAGAITASTLSTMAVFGPLAFVEGMIGQMFRDVAATVCYSMMASLFVAVIVIPMLCSVEVAPQFSIGSRSLFPWSEKLRGLTALNPYSSRDFRGVLDFFKKILVVFSFMWGFISSKLSNFASVWLEQVSEKYLNAYRRWAVPSLNKISYWFYAAEQGIGTLIPKIIQDSKKTMRWAVWSTVVGVILISWRGTELFPDEAVDRLVYDLEFPTGQSIDVTEHKINEIEKDLLKVSGIEGVSSVIGERGENQTRLLIQTAPSLSLLLAKKLNSVLGEVPGLNFNRQKEAMIGEGKPVQIEFYSEDLGILKEAINTAKHAVNQIDGLVDLESSIKSDISEINITFSKNKLNWYSVDPLSFVSTLKAMLMGQPAGVLQFKGEELPTRITVPEKYFDDVGKVRYFSLPQEDGKRIYLSQVSSIEENEVLGSIQHTNRKRMATVSANLFKADLGTVSKKIQHTLGETFGDGKVGWKMGGQDEERKKSAKSLMFAVLLSVFLIYFMLAAQFESFVQPLVILCAVPLCVSGVAVFLILFNLNVSALVFVGFIILVGTSVNTSIVMVEFANQLRVEGKSLKEAITEATKKRMRPIIVVSASNILGLMPMAFSFGEAGSSMQQPLAVTLIGGHLSSTILTMIIVPIIYCKISGKETPHGHT